MLISAITMRQYAVDYYTAPLVSSSMELNTHARKVVMCATRPRGGGGLGTRGVKGWPPSLLTTQGCP